MLWISWQIFEKSGIWSIQEKSGDRIRKQAPLCDQTGTRIILSKFKEYLVKKKNRDWQTEESLVLSYMRHERVEQHHIVK